MSRWGFALAAVLYSSWMLGSLLNPRLDPAQSYASELAATDQPYSALFRSADLITGLIVLVLAILVLRRHARPVTGWLCVADFGLLTMLDSGLTVMSCAPSIDSACAAAESAQTVPWTRQLHTATSTLAAIAPMAGAAIFAWSWRSRAGIVLALLMATISAVVTWQVLAGSAVGIAQRIQLLLVSAWLCWLASREQPTPLVATDGL